MSPFRWTPNREQAAILLSQGYTIDETAEQVSVSSRTIDRWKSDIEFSQEVDRLSLMLGIASRAERMRMAMRVVRSLAKREIPTHKDLLEWLKYAQSETDGIKLDLTPILEAFASMAGSGLDGADETEDAGNLGDGE